MLARGLRQRALLSASASSRAPAVRMPVPVQHRVWQPEALSSAKRSASSAIFRRVVTPFRPPKFTRGHWMDERGMREVTFVLRDGTRKTVQGQDGTNLLEVAHENGIEMEGACEGSCACSTCHVIVEQDTFDKLPEASEEEEDLLDLAPGLESTSRLGCQLILNEDTENGVFYLPKTTLNFYVDGHVPEPH